MAFNYNEELKDASLLINFGGTFLQAYEFEGAKKIFPDIVPVLGSTLV